MAEAVSASKALSVTVVKVVLICPDDIDENDRFYV